MNERSHRRLLDLLAGWAQYVQLCSESEDPHPGVTAEEYAVEAETIRDLYQRAGSMPETPEGLGVVMKAIVDLVVHGPQTPGCCDHEH